MKKNSILSIILMVGLCFPFIKFHAQTTTYQGKPWHDSIQVIPGKVECEKYDVGGEGIAYHDTDSVNDGSGKLNPNDGTFYNIFRMNEGVDISYTKSGGTDDNPYNKVEPVMKHLYVGWTDPGEWIKYSVVVKEDGYYDGTLMYTANADGKIAIDVDGKNWLEPVVIKSTYNANDSLAWRQWHHWNKQRMNYDYIEFNKQK
jgi:hypothetical protein